MGDWLVAYRVLGEGRVPTERYYLEDLVVDRRIILKSILKGVKWGTRTGLIMPRMGTGGRLL
jgi:hypothetical protein